MYIKLYNICLSGIAAPYRFEIVDEISDDDYVYSGFGEWGARTIDSCYLMILDLDNYEYTLKASFTASEVPGSLENLIDYIGEASLDYRLGVFIDKLN